MGSALPVLCRSPFGHGDIGPCARRGREPLAQNMIQVTSPAGQDLVRTGSAERSPEPQRPCWDTGRMLTAAEKAGPPAP